MLDLEAERHGCRWVALDDWGDDSHQGALLKFMRGWIAKGERTKTAERMQRGKRQRAREGKIVPAGRAPLGFVYADGAYRVDEADMQIVRKVFELSAAGNGLWTIRKTLKNDGIRTPGSNRKGPSEVRNVNTLRRIITRDEYLAHGPDHIRELVAAGNMTETVAATLDPAKSYGISWYNRHESLAPNGKRRRGARKPRKEWIAVPVPDAGVPREHVEKARAGSKGGASPESGQQVLGLGRVRLLRVRVQAGGAGNEADHGARLPVLRLQPVHEGRLRVRGVGQRRQAGARGLLGSPQHPAPRPPGANSNPHRQGEITGGRDKGGQRGA